MPKRHIFFLRLRYHEKVIISLGYTEVKKKHLIETKYFGFIEEIKPAIKSAQ